MEFLFHKGKEREGKEKERERFVVKTPKISS